MRDKVINKKTFTKQRAGEERIRLNKYISDCGYCSRREADKIIEQGNVMVDGHVAVLGEKINIQSTVIVNGDVVSIDEQLELIAFNKPIGIECTADLDNPDNIIDYINYGKRIYPIGRLDKNSEGLMLLTNDGEIVNMILKASNYHEKEYIVKVDKPITNEFLKRMSQGVPILDTVTRPCEVTKEGKYTFRIVLTQGLNRQIRRMCEYLGYNVVKLKRVRIMNICLGKLKTGTYRDVTPEEFEKLIDSKH
ncbi:MAG: pseudouridine synthase [Eubacterium sp.]